MIKHCVFLNLAENADLDLLMDAYELIGESLDEIEGVFDYAAGPNRDFEKMSVGYETGFVITFADEAAHKAYLANEKHRQAGEALVSLCYGGKDGIMVFDLDCGDGDDEIVVEA